MFPFTYLAPFPKLYVSLFPLCLILKHSHLLLLSKSVYFVQVGGSSCCQSWGSSGRVCDRVCPHMAQSPAHRVTLHRKDRVRIYSLCSSLHAFCCLYIKKKKKERRKDNQTLHELPLAVKRKEQQESRFTPAFLPQRWNSALATSSAHPGGVSAWIAVHPWFPPGHNTHSFCKVGQLRYISSVVHQERRVVAIYKLYWIRQLIGSSQRVLPPISLYCRRSCSSCFLATSGVKW